MKRGNILVLLGIGFVLVIIAFLLWFASRPIPTAALPVVGSVATETGNDVVVIPANAATKASPSVLTGTQYPTFIPTATDEPLQPYTLETLNLPAGLPNLNVIWNAKDLYTGADDVYFGNLISGVRHIVGGDKQKYSAKRGNISGNYYFLAASKNDETKINRVSDNGSFQIVATLPFTAHALWLSPDETVILVTGTPTSPVDTAVYLVNQTNGEATQLEIGEGMKELVGWLDGQTVMLSNSYNAIVSLVTYSASQQAVANIQTSDAMRNYQAMTLAPSKQYVLLSGGSMGVSLLTLADSSVRLLVNNPDEVVYQSRWSTSGDTVIVELFGNNKIYEINVADGHPVEKYLNFVDVTKFYAYTKIEALDLLVAEQRIDQQIYFVQGENVISQIDLTAVKVSQLFTSEYWLP